MAELSPIMQDSMKEEEDIVLYRYEVKKWVRHKFAQHFYTNEWGIYLHSYSVASAGPSSEEDSMEHMELETRGIEMDSSNPSYKRLGKNAHLSSDSMGLVLMVNYLMPIPSASQDATYVFVSSRQRPISAPISGLDKCNHLCRSNHKNFLGMFIWERQSTAVLRAFLALTARKCSLARATWQNMLEPCTKERRESTKR